MTLEDQRNALLNYDEYFFKNYENFYNYDENLNLNFGQL